jgi:hypothetical protein
MDLQPLVNVLSCPVSLLSHEHVPYKIVPAQTAVWRPLMALRGRCRRKAPIAGGGWLNP